MKIFKRINDMWRGYSAEDIDLARKLIARPRKYGLVWVTERQKRAIVGEGLETGNAYLVVVDDHRESALKQRSY